MDMALGDGGDCRIKCKILYIFKLQYKMTRNFDFVGDLFGLNCQVYEGIHSLPLNFEGDSKEKLEE